jgi:hypothetical protein
VRGLCFGWRREGEKKLGEECIKHKAGFRMDYFNKIKFLSVSSVKQVDGVI